MRFKAFVPSLTGAGAVVCWIAYREWLIVSFFVFVCDDLRPSGGYCRSNAVAFKAIANSCLVNSIVGIATLWIVCLLVRCDIIRHNTCVSVGVCGVLRCILAFSTTIKPFAYLLIPIRLCASKLVVLCAPGVLAASVTCCIFLFPLLAVVEVGTPLAIQVLLLTRIPVFLVRTEVVLRAEVAVDVFDGFGVTAAIASRLLEELVAVASLKRLVVPLGALCFT